MMPGMIMLWYGSVETIPSGWALCDGNNNTPNLRGKYIKGAHSVSPPVGDTGGATSHLHPFTGDGHAHDLASGDEFEVGVDDKVHSHITTVSPATGDTDGASSEPPFHCLCYIMKLPIP